MNYEQQFLKDFSDFIDFQLPLMEKAERLAESDEAKAQYATRLDVYSFLQGKMNNYKAGKSFDAVPDGLI